VLISYQHHFLGRAAMNDLVSYKMENMGDNDLVVFDSRIFRGQGTWYFVDKHYLETNHIQQLMNSQEQFPGGYSQIPTYFIECVPDDCGWGTIKDQPEFNKTMEEIVSAFKNQSQLVATIYDKKYVFPFSIEEREEFKVYRTTFKICFFAGSRLNAHVLFISCRL
jgi:hypothetical protein